MKMKEHSSSTDSGDHLVCFIALVKVCMNEQINCEYGYKMCKLWLSMFFLNSNIISYTSGTLSLFVSPTRHPVGITEISPVRWLYAQSWSAINLGLFAQGQSQLPEINKWSAKPISWIPSHSTTRELSGLGHPSCITQSLLNLKEHLQVVSIACHLMNYWGAPQSSDLVRVKTIRRLQHPGTDK